MRLPLRAIPVLARRNSCRRRVSFSFRFGSTFSRLRTRRLRAFLDHRLAALPVGQRYGNLGRNAIYGPGAVNWNVSAFKDFRLMERTHLEFRTDFFNIFNEVNIGNPNTTLTSANFGRITSAEVPRILQFCLKLLF